MDRIFIILLIIGAICCRTAAPNDEDVKILEKCLLQISNRDNLERHISHLASYADWTTEQVPCLARCMAHEKRWFDIDSNKWQKQRLVDELGADMYNYCRFELDRRSHNGCAYAHSGFRCLKQAEMHVSATYMTLLQCARHLNASNEQLLQYTRMKQQEVVPCLFECFATRMQFYTPAGNWQLDNWIKAFGPIKNENMNFELCRIADERRQKQDKCAWMYEEYRCWERSNELGDINTTTPSTLSVVSGAETTTTVQSTN